MSSDASLPDTNEPARDTRLYLPHSDGWVARIKDDGEREYCFFKNPGEDYFHLIVMGELYLQFGDDKYCLNCALRHGKVTTNRLFWQRRQPWGDAPPAP